MSIATDKVYAMKCHNTHLIAEGSKLAAKHLDKEELADATHGHWTIEKDNDVAYLKSYNNHYVAIDAHHKVHLCGEKDKTCQFQLIQDDSTGMWEFKSGNGHFLAIDDSDKVTATHDQPTKDQKFRLEPVVHHHHKKHEGHSHHAETKDH